MESIGMQKKFIEKLLGKLRSISIKVNAEKRS
jgi:hypothetical protein